MKIHLFGAATPTGEALRQLCSLDLIGYSRNVAADDFRFHHADLKYPSDFHVSGSPDIPAIWVSFAPIWLLAPFLEFLTTHHPERLLGLRGVVACSSSSASTKRFAFNQFDRNLVVRLVESEDQLLDTCRRLSIACYILRPTLVYGQIGPYTDINISRLLQQLRRFPLLPLPAQTGLRQPIHASQLAAVSLHFVDQIICNDSDPYLQKRISLGGDTTLTYAEMITAIQKKQPIGDSVHSCRLLFIPNRFFYFLATPFLLCSPKWFEAVLRIGANLSGFTPAHQILGGEPQPFPVLPLA